MNDTHQDWKTKVMKDYEGILPPSQIEATISYWQGVIDQAIQQAREQQNKEFVVDLKSRKSSPDKSWSFGTIGLAQGYVDSVLDQLIAKYEGEVQR